ncbi:MAG: hypothetical protein HUU34_05680 [Saprospiraceae bacterium]|nr:hypothetical protein [Saprospiraceae bacterium]
MIVSMQGNWKVTVKSKSADYAQRFVVSGALLGNGPHNGTPGTSVQVIGSQWSIAVQNNPGSGFQLSDTKITFPTKVGGNYEFEIRSNDAGHDEDFNDLVLTCSTPATINDFILFGNVSLYSGRCIFNPCRRFPFVVESYPAMVEALKNPKLRDIIKKLYPERVTEVIPDNLPDPPPFKPIVLDPTGEATQPKTMLLYSKADNAAAPKRSAKSAAAEEVPELLAGNFKLEKTVQSRRFNNVTASLVDNIEIANLADRLFPICISGPAPHITLTFEEYDRTAAELAGGAYTGTGNRRLLGDTITDAFGNYIFRFRFDMTFPGIEDSTDVATGEDINIVAYPDIIVKVTGSSPFQVLYESAPYYNVPNLKRINLCLPKSKVVVTSACFNGNLIGSLGNVFLGGNQNDSGSTSASALRRYGNNNSLEADGKISVGSSLALFSVNCAAWGGTIDMKGCMYDAAKSPAQNTIKWYTIRIRRQGTTRWEFVSQNYKHPKFSKRNLPNYTGDDVGPFNVALKVDGGSAQNVPAYTNIQREIFADGVDWEFSNLDRYMQLNTALYDLQNGEHTPGTFYVRVDGYDAGGNRETTDLIPLYIHNVRLNFGLTGITLDDSSVLYAGCGLYRLTDAQMNVPMKFSFRANDPYGFVDAYALTMGRCPAPTIALEASPMADTPAGATVLSQGQATANTPHTCPGYTGTIAEFSDTGMIEVTLQPAAAAGWIQTGEYYTVYSFGLTASKRVTNGYNTGIESSPYITSNQIALERLP